MTYPEARTRISGLACLKPGWDSYGADPIAPESIAAALKLLNEAERRQLPSPWVCPTPDGGVQLEWWVGSRGFEVEAQAGEDDFDCLSINKKEAGNGRYHERREALEGVLAAVPWVYAEEVVCA